MRLINVDKLNDDIETTIKDSGLCYHDEEIMDCIDNAQTVDAVQVVRCKDCKYRDDYDRCTNKNNIRSVIDCDGDTLEYRIDVTDSHFCSYAKRKDGTDNA